MSKTVILDASKWNGSYSTSHRVADNGTLVGAPNWEVTKDFKHIKPAGEPATFFNLIRVMHVFEDGVQVQVNE